MKLNTRIVTELRTHMVIDESCNLCNKNVGEELYLLTVTRYVIEKVTCTIQLDCLERSYYWCANCFETQFAHVLKV